MKQLAKLVTACAIFLLVMAGCQKELSVENNMGGAKAEGTLLDSSGNCQSAIIRGSFVMDSTMTDSNYALINVNFTGTGKYVISTDTVNGVWFIDSGYVQVAGSKTIQLKAYGTPILPITSTFLVQFNGQFCSISINTVAELDYLPTNAGSNWTYQYLPSLMGSSGPLDSFKLTTLVQYIPYNNKNYYQYATSLADTFYFAKDANNTYYEFGTVDFDYTSIFDDIGGFIEYPYLKDKAPVGTSWESDEMDVLFGSFAGVAVKPGKAKSVFTIAGVNQTMTIAGKTLTNVITVKREIYFKETGGIGFSKVLTGTSSYAKGIGMVDQNIILSATDSQSVTATNWKIN
ncbi:MAG TPA: hypothetical protein PLK14_02310 [Sediminibacterium sp.]|jgi:hypothetical protein|nr:hypothetical protein [Sediminibacterium sp.]HQS53903.1 hypothetical protein [Sediminibacterium sp.]